ncbi:MAG TPA: N-methyl-D-aspartate receptor NMDAR2C subunit [Verrucomicrobiae bacterium]|nr:N-methyl-D-aspartate receptor NMDAR2C subunit [Verrucomicrobiae bacterium]
MAAANENQWREFWQRLGARGDALPTWRELETTHSESGRAYHNLHHIGHCLDEFARVCQLADDPVAVEAAIWFHDVIYDTHRKDNEERSAEFASTALAKAGKPDTFCTSVHTLILATKHNSLPTSNDASLLTDIDLSILGQNPERYTEFEQQIRREYAWVTDKDYAAGRSSVLNGFLQRERIFNTPAFAQRFEEQARINLAWAIKQLAT